MKVSCRLYVEVTEPEDLLTVDFDALPQPLFVMGGGSNLLFTKDFPGTVLHMANKGIEWLENVESKDSWPSSDGLAEAVSVRTYRPGAAGDNRGQSPLKCAAGVVFDDFCAWAAAEGLWGPENLSLIPGEVGASAVQNIGAYGVEAKDIIDTVHAFDLTTRTFVDIPCADCAYGYRTSRFKTEWKGRFIITAVTFRLSAVPQPKLDYGGVRKALGDREATPQIIRETIIAIREQKLPDPAKIGSAGSFFCNPVIDREHFERIVAIAKAENGLAYEVPHYDVGDRVKVPAAWMIDQCGFKGAREGGAQVYPRQPLVIVNATGDATPEEIITLERRIIDTIREKYGIELHPEVEHIAAQEIEN
jgi:UDP-N-acetylmuramate dehydrogenase